MTRTNEPDIAPTDPLSIHGLRLHLLAHGDRFDVTHRKVLATAQ
jgi:cyanophycinase